MLAPQVLVNCRAPLMKRWIGDLAFPHRARTAVALRETHLAVPRNHGVEIHAGTDAVGDLRDLKR